MKNQKPFMFITRKGFFAEVKLHNLETGKNRTVNSEYECTDDNEVAAYRDCIQNYKCAIIGTTLAEPIA